MITQTRAVSATPKPGDFLVDQAETDKPVIEDPEVVVQQPLPGKPRDDGRDHPGDCIDDIHHGGDGADLEIQQQGECKSDDKGEGRADDRVHQRVPERQPEHVVLKHPLKVPETNPIACPADKAYGVETVVQILKQRICQHEDREEERREQEEIWCGAFHRFPSRISWASAPAPAIASSGDMSPTMAFSHQGVMTLFAMLMMPGCGGHGRARASSCL